METRNDSKCVTWKDLHFWFTVQTELVLWAPAHMHTQKGIKKLNTKMENK